MDLMHHIKDKPAMVLLCANIDDKAVVVIGMSESAISMKDFDACSLIKKNIAPLIRGGGGGQKTLATAGGQHAADLPFVIETVKNRL